MLGIRNSMNVGREFLRHLFPIALCCVGVIPCSAISLSVEAGEDEDARVGAGSISLESKVPARPSPAKIPITANKPSNRNGFEIFLRRFMMLFQFII